MCAQALVINGKLYIIDFGSGVMRFTGAMAGFVQALDAECGDFVEGRTTVL
jgi:hypothetical protein